MKRKLVTSVIVVLVLAAVGGAAWYIHGLVQERQASARREETPEGPPTVTVAAVQRGTLERLAAATGEVEALQTVDVVPETAGRLEKLRLPDGTLVEEGVTIRPDEEGELPVIAVVEHEALRAAVDTAGARVASSEAMVKAARKTAASARAAVDQAESAVEVAEAGVRMATVELADAEREHQRYRRLHEEGAATQRQLDQQKTRRDAAEAARAKAQAQAAQARSGVQHARAQAEQAEAQVASAEAGLAEARSLLREAELRLDDAFVRAEIAGVVTRKYVDEGNHISISPPAPVAQIGRLETVKIIGGVSERHLRYLRRGETEAVIRVDAWPDREFNGTVYLVGQTVDPATRMVEVEVRIDNPELRLRPGMFARVRFLLERRRDVPIIPETAVSTVGGQTHVYVVEDGKARRRDVTLGLNEGERHEVLEGLAAGEKVVTQGQAQIQDGMEVATEEAQR